VPLGCVTPFAVINEYAGRILQNTVSTASTSSNGKSKCAGPPGTTVCNSCMLQQRLLLPKVLQKQDCSLLLSNKQFIYNRSIRCMNPSTTWPCWLPRPDAIIIGALDTHLLPIYLRANSKRAHTWINLTMVLNPRARPRAFSTSYSTICTIG